MKCSFSYYVYKTLSTRILNYVQQYLLETDSIDINAKILKDDAYKIEFKKDYCLVREKSKDALEFLVGILVYSNPDAILIDDIPYENIVYLKFEGSLKDIENSKLTYVGEDFPDFKMENLFTDELVPHIKSADFDQIACDILISNGFSTAEFVNPIKLADSLGLQTRVLKFTKDSSTKGRMTFYDTYVDKYDESGKFVDKVKINGKTILIDSYAFKKYKKDETKRNVLINTLFHEIVHWVLHRYSIELMKLCSDLSVPFPAYLDTDERGTFKKVEKQARAIGARMQMPYDHFVGRANELLANYPDDLARMSGAIDTLSKEFHASVLSVRIRLIECGFTLARGVRHWLDNRYLCDYKVSSNCTIRYNETYTISKNNFKRLLESSDDFRILVENNFFVYIDGHVCINDNKLYDTFMNVKIPRDELLNNIDKYCVKFKFESTLKNKDYSDDYSNSDTFLFTLSNQHVGSPFNISIADAQSDEVSCIATESLKKIWEIKSQISSDMSFGSSLKVILESCGVTMEQLALDIGVSPSTIGRIARDEVDPKIETIAKICIVLNLPAVFGNDLVEKARIHLRDFNKKESKYKMIISCAQSITIEQMNALMNSKEEEKS